MDNISPTVANIPSRPKIMVCFLVGVSIHVLLFIANLFVVFFVWLLPPHAGCFFFVCSFFCLWFVVLFVCGLWFVVWLLPPHAGWFPLFGCSHPMRDGFFIYGLVFMIPVRGVFFCLRSALEPVCR
jgi:hypothetical protein